MLGIKTLAALLCVGFTYGCATPTSQIASGSLSSVQNEELEQTALALKTEMDRTQKLNDLYWPLRVENADLCGDNIGLVGGFTVGHVGNFGKNFQEAASKRLGIGDALSVFMVADGSPASKAGLQVGDKLNSVNGEILAQGAKGIKQFNKALNNDSLSHTLGVSRNGQAKTLTLNPEYVCTFDIVLVNDPAINAFADGTNVYITTGMMRFAESDQELQLVMAHELAHNSEGHMNKKGINSILGAVLDITAAAYGVNTQGAFMNATGNMYSQEFESEADYVGLYMLANANVPTMESANFWRRMAAENPGNIRGSYGSSHPSTAQRWTNINAAEREIDNKKAAGSRLTPERQE